MVTTPLRYVPQDQKWYQQAKAAGRPAWTEPFVDTGGGEIPMVSYVAPLRRPDQKRHDEKWGDEFVGVLTVDLSLRYFDRLRDWLTDLQFGPRSYGFVASQDGNVLSHPDQDFDFGRRFDAGHKSARRITDLDAADPAFADPAGRMRREPTGRGRATDPATGRPATFLFARVQLDRALADRAWWTFVAVIEE